MRPPGEVRQALLDAAKALTSEHRAPTLLELCNHAQVGIDAGYYTVRNLVRSGALVFVRQRRVDYRNRPVHEYTTPAALVKAAQSGEDLRQVFSSWALQAA